ncbi:hypothetical protein [Clostridium ihumii]|uniref:hypothetical protein n=1 Tax=Clostridium ihumii TaxID=1470356 RepID=UPI003D331E13
MEDFKILKLVKKFEILYKKIGVDYDTMILILRMKLTMDGRKIPTVLSGSQGNDDKDKNQFKRSLIYYCILGLLCMMMIIIDVNIMIQMTIYFGMIMFMIFSVFISDFSSVILDVRDKNLIGIRGVGLKTVNAAKITHIMIYIFQITLALCGFSILASFKYGITFCLVFILEIVFIDIFMITVTALLYFVILKFFDGEKLKDMINIVQIVLTVVIVVMSQLMGRIFNVVEISSEYNIKLVHCFLPPMWFAAPLEMINKGSVEKDLLILTMIGIIIPIIAIIIYSRISNSFENYLIKLNSSESKVKKKNTLAFKLSKYICRDKEERMFFNFSHEIICKERELKLKIYPDVALSLVFPVIFLFIAGEKEGGILNALNQLKNSNSFLTMYWMLIAIPSITMMMQYSENYKGAWIYNVVHIENKKSIYKGCIKAFIYKFIIPMFIICSLIYIAIFKTKVIVHLVAMFLVMLITIVGSFNSTEKNLPFSLAFSMTTKNQNIGKTLLLMVVVAVFAMVHYLLLKTAMGIYIYIGVLILATIIVWNKGFNVKEKS